MTAALALTRKGVSNRKPAGVYWGLTIDLHATQTQDTSQGSLCLGRHLQVPHQSDRQKTQDKIADRCSNTVEIGDGDEDIDV